MDSNLRILGLAKKAGLLAVGTEPVETAAKLGKAVVILSASDASDRSKRNAQICAEMCGAEHIEVPYTKFDLGCMLGRGTPGMVAVLDAGLAAKFTNGLVDTNANMG